jgi:hypothetical protein
MDDMHIHPGLRVPRGAMDCIMSSRFAFSAVSLKVLLNVLRAWDENRPLASRREP